MNTQDRLYHLAKEIDARVTAVEQAAEAGRKAILTWNIASGLGKIKVDGTGTLIAVELDPDAVETQTEASLSRHVLRAITDAESAARTELQAMVGDAGKGAGR